jgi:hypothetical protein
LADGFFLFQHFSCGTYCHNSSLVGWNSHHTISICLIPFIHEQSTSKNKGV